MPRRQNPRDADLDDRIDLTYRHQIKTIHVDGLWMSGGWDAAAIRNQLTTHAEEVRQTVARKTLVLGLQNYSRRDLEAVREAGETLEIRVLGLASIDDDVDPGLALETIDSLIVLGALRASPAVKAALRDRIQSS